MKTTAEGTESFGRTDYFQPYLFDFPTRMTGNFIVQRSTGKALYETIQEETRWREVVYNRDSGKKKTK